MEKATRSTQCSELRLMSLPCLSCLSVICFNFSFLQIAAASPSSLWKWPIMAFHKTTARASQSSALPAQLPIAFASPMELTHRGSGVPHSPDGCRWAGRGSRRFPQATSTPSALTLWAGVPQICLQYWSKICPIFWAPARKKKCFYN